MFNLIYFEQLVDSASYKCGSIRFSFQSFKSKMIALDFKLERF